MDKKNNTEQTESSCYCEHIDDDFRKKENIPEGYCGICEMCGKPGHTRHYPGARPYTSSWCDECYAEISKPRKGLPLLYTVFVLGIIGISVFYMNKIIDIVISLFK